MGKILQQTKAVMSKNFKLLTHTRQDLISEILAPIIILTITGLNSLLGDQFFLSFLQFLGPVSAQSLYRKLIVGVVSEKSEKYRETQKIIGLSGTAYQLGWILTFMIRSLFVSLLLAVLVIIQKDCFQDIDIATLVVYYFMQNIAIVSFNFFLTVFFERPQFSSEICSLFQSIIPFIPFFLDKDVGQWLFVLLSFIPQANSAILIFGQQMLGKFVVEQKGYTLGYALGMQVANSVLYLVLYLYLDQVIPNEFGISKHPLFFIKDLFKKESTYASLQESLLKSNLQDEQETCSAKFFQPLENRSDWKRTIRIRNLVKDFDGFKAVNGLSFDLYESKILCLLGHNGAGKTTTIQLLTGLLKNTEGNINIYGYDTSKDIDIIRGFTGLCSQKDLLYDNLTVYEHMYFQCQIKLIPKDKMQEEIDNVLAQCGILQDRDKKAGIMNGGNKRKLSLAMSLVGGNKIIYLDEPTSGLDPVSRQEIWKILEQIRSQNRTIILTTHFLDEADRLADRISIMSRGQLLAMGTTQFIKRKFGEGYQLILNNNKQNEQSQYDQEIQEVLDYSQKNVQNSKVVSQDKLQTKLLLPFDQINQFEQFCEFVEQKTSISHSFQLNTLEDAYINIGLEEDKFFENDDGKVNTEYNKLDVKKQPECMSKLPQQIFIKQLECLLLRRVYNTYRDWTLIFQSLFPTLFTIVGVVLVKYFQDNKIDQLVQVIIFSNLSAFAYCLNTTVFVATNVMEREFKLKYALNVMGCKILPYWLSNLIFDYVLYVLTIVLLVLFVQIEQVNIIQDYLGKFSITMLLFGLNLTSLSYCLGFMFSKKTSAMKVFPILLYILFFSVPWGFVNGFQKASVELSQFFEVFFAILCPPFTWSRSLIVYLDDIDKYLKPKPIITNFWHLILIMVCQFIVCISITLLLDYLSQKVRKDGNQYAEQQQNQVTERPLSSSQILLKKSSLLQNLDEIEQENMKVWDQSNDFNVKLDGVYKQYDNGFQAINGLSLGVEKNMLFGLLGPNGAGKSTTFNILTAAQSVTKGDVYLKNVQIRDQMNTVYKDVGICPQTDCIWENLTVLDHLKLFGKLKGLNNQDLQKCIDYFVEIMQLQNYTNTRAKNLSGGNKRKLCVANALMGGPDLLFFDEPSTGLDPIAKRFLWNSLKQNIQKKESSIILTTHSMEEAEYLCNKIGILVNGKFICLGTLQQLQEKFGGGFNLGIKTNDIDKVDEELQKCYTKIKQLPDNKNNYFNFQVTDKDFKYSQVFKLMLELQSQGLVLEFSVQQNTLEQIFIYFSKFQQDNEKQ